MVRLPLFFMLSLAALALVISGVETAVAQSYVIVDGVSFTTRGKPVSVRVGDDYVVLIHRGNLACHNGSERSLMVGSPCYTAAAWDDELNTFNSPSGSELVLGVSEFEP